MELSETADFVYNFETQYRRATWVEHLTDFSFDFYAIFTQDASLLFLYHGAKKSRMTKKSNHGGPALKKDGRETKMQANLKKKTEHVDGVIHELLCGRKFSSGI